MFQACLNPVSPISYQLRTFFRCDSLYSCGYITSRSPTNRKSRGAFCCNTVWITKVLCMHRHCRCSLLLKTVVLFYRRIFKLLRLDLLFYSLVVFVLLFVCVRTLIVCPMFSFWYLALFYATILINLLTYLRLLLTCADAVVAAGASAHQWLCGVLCHHHDGSYWLPCRSWHTQVESPTRVSCKYVIWIMNCLWMKWNYYGASLCRACCIFVTLSWV